MYHLTVLRWRSFNQSIIQVKILNPWSFAIRFPAYQICSFYVNSIKYAAYFVVIKSEHFSVTIESQIEPTISVLLIGQFGMVSDFQ